MSEIAIRPLCPHSDLAAVVAIHSAAFPDSGLTALGRDTLRRYYAWQLDESHELSALVAQCSGVVAGYCLAGGSYGSMAAFCRTHPMHIAAQLLKRPWLLFSRKLGRAASYAVRLIRKSFLSKAHKARSAAMGSTTFGIQAIAVDPAYAGRGAGKLLLKASEDEARRRGMESMYLAVETTNTNAIQFYESQGWMKVTRGDFWNGHMRKQLTSAQHAAGSVQ